MAVKHRQNRLFSHILVKFTIQACYSGGVRRVQGFRSKPSISGEGFTKPSIFGEGLANSLIFRATLTKFCTRIEFATLNDRERTHFGKKKFR